LIEAGILARALNGWHAFFCGRFSSPVRLDQRRHAV